MCGVRSRKALADDGDDALGDGEGGRAVRTVGPMRVRSDSFADLLATSVGGHVSLMRTGDIAIMQEYWSPTVFVSCLAFCLPGVVYAAAAWYWMAAF